MNKFALKLAAGMVAMAVVAGAHGASVDYFLKIDGVEGETNAQNGTAPAGKRMHKPFVIKKELDKNASQGSATSVKSDQPKPQPAGLLIPAVQSAKIGDPGRFWLTCCSRLTRRRALGHTVSAARGGVSPRLRN